jgi:purine-binding chemotaxis protein CheW
MLILRINDLVYGTIVDKIDKVVGINSESIQPPHPIFGDINIKFISGVVEKQGELYIILDVVRIFGQNKEDKEKERGGVSDSGAYFVPASPPVAEQVQEQPVVSSNSTIEFLKEALSALKHFVVSPLNEVWFNKRFAEWRVSRTDADLQLRDAADADDFLSQFASPFTGTFWDDNYAESVKSAMPKVSTNAIQVWNIGCGKGYETFSFACILKSVYPDAQIKIWANDSDIMAISQVPSMVIDEPGDVPEYCRPFLVKGKNGYSFNQVIKDSIVFEYHDVLHDTPLPDLDIILARDIMSYFPEKEQARMIEGFAERLKNHGLVIMGKNEEIFGGSWTSLSNETVSVFANNA